MDDIFDSMPVEALASPGSRHFAVVPSDATNFTQRPRAIVCLTAGTAQIVDGAGTVVGYPMTAGQVLPFRGVRVNATGTNGTYAGWY